MPERPDLLTLKRHRDKGGPLRAARMQQIAKLGEIQCAVLETSGQISFIKRS